MNRIIKFRAWCPLQAKMFVPFTLEQAISETDAERHENIDIFMQFTGLKDKNGKKIYEGDIIENNGKRWKIYWHNPSPCYCMVICGKERSGNDPLFIGEAEHSEVIGDIYTTPNLLTP